MRIPDQFILRIGTQVSTQARSIIGTYFSGRKSKDLLEKVPIELSFAKSLYSGGRYSYENKFSCEVKLIESYDKEVREIVFLFKKIIK